MKAFMLNGYGGLEHVVLRDIAVPEPAHGQVLVRMRAAALNARDLMVVAGVFQQVAKPEPILLSDGVGEVVKTGPGVWRLHEGDRVAPIFTPEWIAGAYVRGPGSFGRAVSVDGVMAEYVCLDQNELVTVPAHLTDEEAATLPCAAVTAWSALCAYGTLLPGMSVLVQGTGGVSVFALQFAKLFGARVVATTSSAAKAARLKALGADAVIDTNAAPEWQDEVLKLTGGVDVAVDIGGGASLRRSVAVARESGRVSVVGVFEGMPDAGADFFSKGVQLHPIRTGSREHFEQMNRAIAVNGLKPVIDKVFAFEELPHAFGHLAGRGHMGKIVVRIP